MTMNLHATEASRLRGHGKNGSTNGQHFNGTGPLIELCQVPKVLQSAAGEYRALKGIGLEIGRGEFVGIIGRLGSGKSTQVNIIIAIGRPLGGEVLVSDTAVALKGIALAMGVAVIVLNTLNTLTTATAIALLSMGLTALAMAALQKD